MDPIISDKSELEEEMNKMINSYLKKYYESLLNMCEEYESSYDSITSDFSDFSDLEDVLTELMKLNYSPLNINNLINQDIKILGEGLDYQTIVDEVRNKLKYILFKNIYKANNINSDGKVPNFGHFLRKAKIKYEDLEQNLLGMRLIYDSVIQEFNSLLNIYMSFKGIKNDMKSLSINKLKECKEKLKDNNDKKLVKVIDELIKKNEEYLTILKKLSKEKGYFATSDFDNLISKYESYDIYNHIDHEDLNDKNSSIDTIFGYVKGTKYELNLSLTTKLVIRAINFLEKVREKGKLNDNINENKSDNAIFTEIYNTEIKEINDVYNEHRRMRTQIAEIDFVRNISQWAKSQSKEI